MRTRRVVRICMSYVKIWEMPLEGRPRILCTYNVHKYKEKKRRVLLPL